MIVGTSARFGHDERVDGGVHGNERDRAREEDDVDAGGGELLDERKP